LNRPACLSPALGLAQAIYNSDEKLQTFGSVGCFVVDCGGGRMAEVVAVPSFLKHHSIQKTER